MHLGITVVLEFLCLGLIEPVNIGPDLGNELSCLVISVAEKHLADQFFFRANLDEHSRIQLSRYPRNEDPLKIIWGEARQPINVPWGSKVSIQSIYHFIAWFHRASTARIRLPIVRGQV